MPAIPARRKCRKGDLEFEASFSYIESWRAAWAIGDCLNLHPPQKKNK